MGALPPSPTSEKQGKEKQGKLGTVVEPTPSLTVVPTIEHEIVGPQRPQYQLQNSPLEKAGEQQESLSMQEMGEKSDSLRQSSGESDKHAESATEFDAKRCKTDGSKSKGREYAAFT